MALQGQIKEFGLTEIFQLIQIQKREGALRLRNAKSEAILLFDGGAVVMAKSATEDEWMSVLSLLAAANKLTPQQVQEALREEKRGAVVELGPFLVEKGWITREEMEQACKLFVQETLFDLFSWKSGAYEFEPRPVTYNKNYFSKLSSEFIMMEAARRLDEWPRLVKEIPSKGMVFEATGKELLVPASEPTDATKSEAFSFEGLEAAGNESSNLSPEVRRVFELVDGKTAVSTLVSLCLMGEFQVYRALGQLKEGGFIQTVHIPVTAAIESPQRIGVEAPLKPSYGFGRHTVWILLNGILGLLLVLLIFLSVKKINFRAPVYMNAFRPFHELVIGEKLDRVQYALHLYHLRYRAFPNSLSALVSDGDLSEADLLDPWGQPWDFQLTPFGFLLDSRGRSLPSD